MKKLIAVNRGVEKSLWRPLLFAVALAFASRALASGVQTFGLPVETFEISSKHVDQTFEINVYVPEGCAKTACPALYITDSDMFFGMVSGLMGPFGSLIGVGVPSQIVVGIGYPGDGLTSNWYRLRLRDFQEVPENELAIIRKLPYADTAMPEFGHGAPKFLEFIRQELIPAIEDRYPVVYNDRTYFGYSGGYLFGLYTLFSKPETFDRYVIGSGFWKSYLERARKFATSGERINARLFFGVGLDEPIEGEIQGKGAYLTQVSGYLELAALLHESRIPGLEFSYQAWPDENHSTAWVPTFMNGMRAVFLTDGCKPYTWPDGECPERK